MGESGVPVSTEYCESSRTFNLTTMLAQNPRSPIYQLSQELIDEIIDTLAFSTRDQWQGQRACLSSCSLVCRSFVPRSQMYLFSRIALMGDSKHVSRNTSRRVKPFLEILEARPSIASHVQELQLVMRSGQSSWLSEGPDFAKLVDLITTTGTPINKLGLVGEGEYGNYLLTPLLMIESPLRNIVPYITSLCFELLQNIPPQLVAMCPNLQELRFIHAEFLEGVQAPLKNIPIIKSLAYAARYDWQLESIFEGRYFDISNLLSLTAYIGRRSDNLDFEQNIIYNCRHSLEELTINFHAYDQSVLLFHSMSSLVTMSSPCGHR